MSTRTQLGRVGPLVRLIVPVLSIAVLHSGHASESDAPPDASDHQVTLTDADLQMITLAVMKTHPLVAGAGVKHVDAHRSYRVAADDEDPSIASGVSANVIFYPHSETAGIKEALQVHCSREHADGAWACPLVQLRRYVRLDTQDFEVRVKGDLSVEAVLALVEATRSTARSAPNEGSSAADIATIILPCGEGYLVSWADLDHQAGVLVEARLSRDGDPAEPGDWETSLHQER